MGGGPPAGSSSPGFVYSNICKRIHHQRETTDLAVNEKESIYFFKIETWTGLGGILMEATNRSTRWYDYLTVNIYWFGLSVENGVLTPLVLPLLVQEFVGESAKGAYVGTIRLWGLMTAVLVQSLMGILSDRNTSKYGRRKPFIFWGTIGQILLLGAVGYTSGLQGLDGFWSLFLVYLALMAASNSAQAASQSLIPDLIPGEKKGLFSGVKALLEIPLPLIFVSIVIGGIVSKGDIWAALAAAGVVLIICMAGTMLVREQPINSPPFDLDWRSFMRIILMAVVFCAAILLSGEIVQRANGFIGMKGILDPSIFAVFMGGAGMIAALGLGVWASVRIAVGSQAPRNNSFTWWVINRLAFLAAATNLVTFMLFYIQERFPEYRGSAAASPAANVIMFAGIFILLLALPSGWLSDRVGKKNLVGLSGILAAGGVAFALLVPGLTGLYIGGGLIGAGVGLFNPANWALGTEILPPSQAGRYLGISNLAGAGAGAIGAYIGGPIGDSQSYALLFSIFGVLFLLSAAALLGVRKPFDVGRNAV
ncbi:MAG: MFS transporter [Anaerolineales bacterium]